MKRVLAAFSIFMLCSMLLTATLGTTQAGLSAYSIIEYVCVNTATVDGRWTTADEWTDTPVTDLSGNGTGKFGYNIQDFTNLGLEWIVEFFTDNTNDTGDYWQICFDDGNDNTTAPDTDDFMIEIVGHTTLRVYKGTGTGWSLVTPESGEILWNNTISASPWNSTPHWILEVVDTSKVAGVVQIPNAPPTGMRIAAYDANTSRFAAWAPNSNANNPSTWGLISGFSMEPIPEKINLAAVILLSSLTVVIGVYFLQKNHKWYRKTDYHGKVVVA